MEWSVSASAEAMREIQKDERRWGVPAGIVLRELACQGIHLLPELRVAHDGRTPLLHEPLQLSMLTVVRHPARRTQCRKSLAGSSPAVARNRAHEGWVICGNRGQRVRRPEGAWIVELLIPDTLKYLAILH